MLFALLALLLISIWYVSGVPCWGLTYSCEFILSRANSTFLSIGVLSIYLSSIEFIAFHRRNGSIASFSLFNEKTRKIRNIGLASILSGVVLAGFGMFVLNSTLVPCPVSGCSFSTIWEAFGIDYILFFLGQCLVAAGSGILLKLNIKQDRSRLEYNKPLVQ